MGDKDAERVANTTEDNEISATTGRDAGERHDKRKHNASGKRDLAAYRPNATVARGEQNGVALPAPNYSLIAEDAAANSARRRSTARAR